MALYVIFFIVVVVATLVVAVGGYGALRKRDLSQIESRVAGKGGPAAKKAGGDATPIINNKAPSPREVFAQMFLGKDLNKKLRDYIEQAGLDWDPARTIYLALILAVIGFNIFWYLVPRGQPIAIVGVLLGGGAPFFFLYRKRAARMHAFEEQFPDALEYIGRSMRTGHAFTVAIEMLYKEFPAPLGNEFRRTFEEQNLGLPLEVALERLGTRVPLLDVRFFVSTVALQKRTGGNLAGLLDNLAYLIRERFKLRGRIRAISAHGRISGLVLSMIPIVTAILMFYTNPDYVLFFFDDPDGKVILAVMIILQFLGFVSIRKLTDIGV